MVFTSMYPKCDSKQTANRRTPRAALFRTEQVVILIGSGGVFHILDWEGWVELDGYTTSMVGFEVEVG